MFILNLFSSQVCWKSSTLERLQETAKDEKSSQQVKDAANKLISFLDVINPVSSAIFT